MQNIEVIKIAERKSRGRKNKVEGKYDCKSQNLENRNIVIEP